ncbi:MAG: trypsin-like peptidase domain-containing protein [Chloroflexota bacterium]|nr:trypsin-like peptidase domain-containing protein [Chloroflexota bacterium]
MNWTQRWLTATALLLAVMFGVLASQAGMIDIGDGFAQDDEEPTATAVAQDRDQGDSNGAASAVEVVQQVSPAVVTVINEQQVQFPSGDESVQPVGSGTGFIIDEDGHIVTNWHVVTGGSQFEVVFSDGTVREAELIGADPVSDIAVVKVDGDVPATLPFGDSDALLPGEPVLALGSPLGNFQNTVTQGIVSATNRDFPGAGSSQYNNLIQHDAAINPGNSGGPLVNFDGEVVGVNTLGISIDEGGQPVQGLFFAIPSNSVQSIAAQLVEDGEVTYPYVGISYQNNSPAVAAEFDLETDVGVVVLEVPAGGPAVDAGIEVGDVITRVGDYELNGQTTFSEALFNYAPGDTIEMEINRGGDEITVEIELGDRSDFIDE